MNLTEKSVKWLKSAIKQHKKVIAAFQYPSFSGYGKGGDADKDFEKFKQDVLFRLTDQWKKMEAELAARRGRL